MPPKPTNQPIVVLDMPKTIGGKLGLARAVLAAMSAASATYPSPTPSLAQFSADIDGLDDAETATRTKTKGAVDARDDKLRIVIGDLHQLKAYVQQVVGQTPAQAASLAEQAGMRVRRPATHNKPTLVAVPYMNGSARVVAKAVRGAVSYDWQFSIDKTTWSGVPPTAQAKTVIGGLPSATRVWFRMRPVLRTGVGAWTDPVSAVVT